MTIKQAGQIEIAKHEEYVIPPYVEEKCNICHKMEELRAGLCFTCQSLGATDMKEVWEVSNPAHRWPYVWSTGWNIARAALRHMKG